MCATQIATNSYDSFIYCDVDYEFTPSIHFYDGTEFREIARKSDRIETYTNLEIDGTPIGF